MTRFIAAILCFLVSTMVVDSVTLSTKVKGGYWPTGSKIVPASSINATLFTHLFYAFARIENTTSLLIPDPEDNGEIEKFSRVVKYINPSVKTLISISANGPEFQQVMGTPESRQAFINSSINLARSNGFDGLDLDYEFPQSQGEMDNFSSFLTEWREAVDGLPNFTPLLLTAAVYYKPVLKWVGEGAYPIESIAKNLDFVNVMCYDFHGSWDVTATGANANLYDPDSDLSADYGISSWLKAGLPSEKAVLGLTLYGRSWLLKNQSEAAGLNATAVAAGPAQPISQSEGVFFYREVKTFIEEKNATVVHDWNLVTGYAYAENVWVSYEDPIIIDTKVKYAMTKSLRGYFFWAITQDSDWEVSSAASRTMDLVSSSLAPAEAPAPLPTSSAIRTPVSTVYIVVIMLAAMCAMIVFPYTGSSLSQVQKVGRFQ
ncbi:hypothetical protein R1flu_027447 [Riccia fluitans]|uniref:GH18 domain-containing protein n=1 Tax=Riccia fluitans TaxID=41844 RepID=A0ABD1XIU6_9MARC